MRRWARARSASTAILEPKPAPAGVRDRQTGFEGPAHDRILRVARPITGLARAEAIEFGHIVEEIQ